MMTDKLHSIESAAAFLGGISSWTVRAWLKQGRLTRVKIGSRTMLWESQLLKMVQPESKAETAKRNARHELMAAAR